MKTSIRTFISATFWRFAGKLLKQDTFLSALQLKDDSIQINWYISKLDKIRAKYSKSYFFGIRIFDVSLSGSKATSTCVMKEIQISKYNKTCRLFFPSLSSKYFIEIGYRKGNGEWRVLKSIYINLKHHIKEPLKFLLDDDWFSQNSDSKTKKTNLHDKSYQLSLGSRLGGSEAFNKNPYHAEKLQKK